MAELPSAQSLRILCVDGGGIKGYTSLLILKRVFRTLVSEAQLATEPRPCDVFDLIAGTSTGGLIAVMLGRLHMTIDDCIVAYEEVGKRIFGKQPSGGSMGKFFKGVTSSAFYDIGNLQEEVRKVLDQKNIQRDEAFLEAQTPICKVVLCVTRQATFKSDLLRNYLTFSPTEENHKCKIWEAASATAAAPMYFKNVTFEESGDKWCDGGMRRNNPINEALTEVTREKDWKNRSVGCVVSLGTGVPQLKGVPSNLAGFLKGSVEIMTDSEDIADQFAASKDGREMAKLGQYFRFNVPQGLAELEMEDYKERDKMRALTTAYLKKVGSGDEVERCAKSLLRPDENLHIDVKPKPYVLPYNICTHFVKRPAYAQAIRKFFTSYAQTQQIFVLWVLGGVGKTQIALKFAYDMKYRLSVFWVRADQFTNFAADYHRILAELDPTMAEKQDDTITYHAEGLRTVMSKLGATPGNWLMILDNADDLDEFIGKDQRESAIGNYIPRNGRILITTRDKRFQGTVAAALDGEHVKPMDSDEARALLRRSIPVHLMKPDPNEMVSATTELLNELGNLPFAIAQAAANILDQELTLTKYVTLYKEKKERMLLMRVPVRDFQAQIRGIAHSLFCERSISRLTKEEAARYLIPSVALLADCFPFITDTDSAGQDRPLARYLIAHAIRQIELGEEYSILTRPFAKLLQHVASFLRAFGMVDYAAYLETKSLEIANPLWDSHDRFILSFGRTKVQCLNAAARYAEAELAARQTLAALDVDKNKLELTGDELDMLRYVLRGDCATALSGLRKFQEEEDLYRLQLLSKPAENKALEVITMHNLANVLRWQGKSDEARRLNDELLVFSETAEGRQVIPRTLHLRMMNLKGHIRKTLHDERPALEECRDIEILNIYLSVYQESFALLGVANIDTWKAGNNVMGELEKMHMYVEEEAILRQLLSWYISTEMKPQGEFAKTVSITFSTAWTLLSLLLVEDRENEAGELHKFVLDACESAECDIEILCAGTRVSRLNTLGVRFQQRGHFEEAEQYHLQALQLSNHSSSFAEYPLGRHPLQYHARHGQTRKSG
ncbi:hypothetical protein LTR47_011349 [Exophiala xenobiotica]|nr:hypothetical protein LTR41_011408 [Exophiala xenobiotica]KAK5215417.1 hypothetical protein LTR72_011531 [Exophiala xenobiotica]KAK5219851.1 hypothetical protein LTR47_011349 [Exophiala xenobiotica]KAK5243907.1 hypothetical protein LTS06_010426 [Exophiala xenobiotica]KAK5344960.1 hypothetical protein LTR61_011278 [Exophiala xenobiotica]